MTSEERDTIIASINTVLRSGTVVRNTLRDAVARAQRNESMCDGGRNEVYDKLDLASHGVKQPGRYGNPAPAHEEVQELEHPEWYKDTGLRAMEEQVTEAHRAYVEMAATWLARNYARAVSKDFIQGLFTELGWGELPPVPKNVSGYIEYAFTLPADTTEDEDSVRESIKTALGTVVPNDGGLTNEYVSVNIVDADSDE
jgi:hypothetical protein